VQRALDQQRMVLNATGPTTLRLLPPLVATRADLEDAVGRLRTLLST
jgi:acetylornithine/succinyldiaminopimelate/putrescine aminotransferase